MDNSESRDRKCVLAVDGDVQAVLEFMQANIATSKLVGAADSVAQMARLLWGHYPQEPCHAADLLAELPTANTSCEKQPSAI